MSLKWVDAMMKQNTISLAGQWGVALDEKNVGIRERWFENEFKQVIALPGTTDEACLGELTEEACTDRLSRTYRWIGPVWYQKRVNIPGSWEGKQISLYLERTKDSQVWVNDQWVGSDDSLSTPHEYDLSVHLTPGEHTITLLVDNAKLPPIGPCHQVDERTQTNWNGILGRMELTAREPLWIDDLQVYAHRPGRSVEVVACVVNETSWTGAATFHWHVTRRSEKRDVSVLEKTTGKLLGKGFALIKVKLELPEAASCWDEFDPSLLTLTAEVEAVPVAEPIRDSRSVSFGLRSFEALRGQFVVNGRPTMLRGKLDCAIFPLTGYAPMDKQEWVRLLSIAQQYGINHYRFHTWCPPESAFEAADELGIYFLVELPTKRGLTEPGNKDYTPPKEAYETLVELEGDAGNPAVRAAYLKREGERILKHYGNHPSFVMFSLGNELGGDVSVMKGMCDHFRSVDPRHLYAMGSGHFHWDIRYREGDEFWVTRGTGKGLPVRGASYEVRGHVDHRAPSTMVDYAASLQAVPVPVVGHEIASYEVYPNYREIKKYTGVLKAKSFEIFRERLKAAGMLDQANDFLNASGALSVICHREEIETHLRTAGNGGFELLDIQDFSGQGSALVGILDVFMDSKGLVTPETWREFCCETVPLFCMKKYTWTNDERFRGGIKVAHYGAADLKQQTVRWALRAGRRNVAKGEIKGVDLPTGEVTDVDMLLADLKSVKRAEKLCLTIDLKDTPYRNRYDVWVYPAKVKPEVPGGVTVARSFSRETRDALAKGDRVLLIPKPGSLKRSVAMAFQTGFWSPMFRTGDRTGPLGVETPGTQGILCDPTHPLFKDFPTEFHSNWQWWQLVKHCEPLILDETPSGFRPIVQVIDGIDRNHKLGLILELKLGKGRLLVCTIDLPGLQHHPEARQLLSSLYRYVGSREFSPAYELDVDAVKAFL